MIESIGRSDILSIFQLGKKLLHARDVLLWRKRSDEEEGRSASRRKARRERGRERTHSADWDLELGFLGWVH